MEIKLAVCDDEAGQAQYMKMLAGKWAKENNLKVTVDMYGSAEKYKEAKNAGETYDILLLDIEMGGESGMELARELRAGGENLIIVFVTGYAEYMPEGYDVSALHYLVKPIDEHKLFLVLGRARKALKSEPEMLAVEINRKNILIPLGDIVYIESSLNYIMIHTAKGQYKAKMPLTEIEDKLGGGFFRCTRSFIVSLRWIQIITKKEITLTTGVSIPLGRGLYQSINDAFIRYF
jgi:DNA-binding LytR/AlgR family response regulator